MDRPLTADYAKEIANAFVQTYYQSFDNGPRENLSSLYVRHQRGFWSSIAISCFMHQLIASFWTNKKNILVLLNRNTSRKSKPNSRIFDILI